MDVPICGARIGKDMCCADKVPGADRIRLRCVLACQVRRTVCIGPFQGTVGDISKLYYGGDITVRGTSAALVLLQCYLSVTCSVLTGSSTMTGSM